MGGKLIMRFVPGTVRGMLVASTGLRGAVTVMSSMPSCLMFFDGIMPSKADLETRFRSSTGNGTDQSNLRAALEPHQSQYMGCVAWKANMPTGFGIENSEIEIQLEYNAPGSGTTSTASEDNPIATRQARIHRAGKPTWFALGITSANFFNCTTDNIPTNTASNQIYLSALGNVGDEDSDADLKLIGGELFLTQSTPVDLSRVPQIANLVLRFT